LRRLHLLIHSYSQLVHFLALCHISDYIRYPEIKDKKGEEILRNLKRPSLGHWVMVLREIPKYLEQNNLSPFLENWQQIYKRLENSIYPDCIGSDLYSPRVEQNPIEAFLRLRNTLAHGGIFPDETFCEQLYVHHLPILKDLLYSFKFIFDLTVFRLVSYNNETIKVIKLKGVAQPFEEISLNRNIYSTNDIPECFLEFVNKENSTSYLTLTPLLISFLEDDTGFLEPLLIYEGLGNKRVYYLGIKKRFETRKYYDNIIDKFFFKTSFNLKAWNVKLVSLVIQNTQSIITTNQNIKYFPEVYQERQYYSDLVKEFCFNNPSKVSGLLFVAESGVGKTSFVCHTTVQTLDTDEIVLLPFLITSKNLSNLSSDNIGSPIVYQENTLGILGTYIRDIFDTSNVCDWDTLFMILEKCIAKNSNNKNIQILFIVDAINEASNPFYLLQELDYVVNRARKLPWLRCIGTVRKGAYEILEAKFKEYNVKFPRNERAYIREPDESGKPTIKINLAYFSEYEAKHTYERYQQQSQEKTDIPACVTKYNDLPDRLRQIIRHPLILRLLMQTYHKQEVPVNLSPNSLFHQFHNELSTTEKRTISHIVKNCLEKKRATFYASEAKQVLDIWQKDKDEYALLIYLNPIEQLLDSGILLPTSQGDYNFTHQLYFEFLIFKFLLSQKLDNFQLVNTVRNVIETPKLHLEEEIGAIRMVLLKVIKQNNFSILGELINSIHSEMFYKFLTPLILELKDLSNDIYKKTLQEILKQKNQLVLHATMEMYRIIGDRESQLYVIEKILKIENNYALKLQYIHLLIMSNRADEANTVIKEIKNYAEKTQDKVTLLGALTEEGYVNFVISDSKKALSAYSLAMQLLNELKGKLTKEEFLLKKREILGGRGCVEHNIDDNEACVASHSEALSIDKQLDDKSAIALDLVNLADAYWGCYQYGQSLRIYQDAIDASIKSCYQDAMDVALIGRGAVLWSMGRFEDAIISIDKGLEIAHQLNYSWDLAYGMLYKSNVQASLNSLSLAIETNEKALSYAILSGSEYLIMLASSYLFLKLEIKQPGIINRRKEIDDALNRCEQLELKGIKLTLLSVSVLNKVSNPNFTDEMIEKDLNIFIDLVDNIPPVKGPWELFCLHLKSAIKYRRKNIDTIDLEDIIDIVIEQKTASMTAEDRELYLATRKIWKNK
jgi:hypothetical protein